MEFCLEGLDRVRKVAETSDFPGRHAGCVLHLYDGDYAWIAKTNMIAVEKGGPMDLRYKIHQGHKPYVWTPHAEIAAVAEAARRGYQTMGASAYLRGSPCLGCAIVLAQAGIERVAICSDDAFLNDRTWATESGVEYLKDYGVIVVREC
jgi:deoxycytidylate deaminase